MRFRWLLLSIVSLLLYALPAEAGRLLFWRFESTQNRLVFTTDDRVQPKAQLIPNPTRIVIDLPGITLGQAGVNQVIGGAIRQVRVAQFNTQTTRLVIELAAGYTVDPTQVKIRGLSPTQWTVDLPTPQRISQNNLPTPSTPANPQPPSNTNTNPPPRTSASTSSDFQVTRNGLFVRLEKNGDSRRIRVKRSRNQEKIEIELPGAQLPTSLAGKTIAVNDYGVGEISFEQSSSTATITLTVSEDSPDWQAVYSRFDGVVLVPRGGMNSAAGSSSPPPSISVSNPPPSRPQLPNIQSLNLTNNNTQLVIQADKTIRGSGNWNRQTGEYEIRINNAQLAEKLQGPQLEQNSPIYQLKVRQENANTAVILVRPALGAQIGSLRQFNNQQLVLEIRPQQVATTPTDSQPIPVTPPPNNSLPPLNSSSPSLPSVPRGKVLVIIDPGHGGKDPGAIGIGGLQEKDVILPISLEVTRLLEQQGVQVRLTRNSDYFISLQGRTDMANRLGADLFVSIHANSMGKGRPDVNGLEVYYHGNRALSDIIHQNIIRSVRIRDRGVRQARFYVLRNSRMPSTLVEVGFVTGNEDAANLRNPAYQRQMAQAIARGILEYIQRYKR